MRFSWTAYRRAGLIAATFATGMMAAQAAASDLVYQPINPAFGGSPANAGWLMDSAGAQNQHRPDFGTDPDGDGTLTPAQEFAATLQRRLLFAVSDRIVSELFEGDDPEGNFQVEGTVISYRREGNLLHLTIFDGVNETEITIPAGF